MRGTVCVGAEERFVSSVDACLDVVDDGQKERHVSATLMNDQSSRSHTIFRITVESRPVREGEQGGLVDLTDSLSEMDSNSEQDLTVSMLNLIDLAGSERIAKTGATGVTRKEGTMINKSLTTLSKVIMELSKGGGIGHVPYRDSKLTRMLQQALGGNSRCATVCCISTAVEHHEEAKSTLRFASRCKLVENKAVKNVMKSTSETAGLQRGDCRTKGETSRYSPHRHGSILLPALCYQQPINVIPSTFHLPSIHRPWWALVGAQKAALGMQRAALRTQSIKLAEKREETQQVSQKLSQVRVLNLWHRSISAALLSKSQERQSNLEMQLERTHGLNATLSKELEKCKLRKEVQAAPESEVLVYAQKLRESEAGRAALASRLKSSQEARRALSEETAMERVRAKWKAAVKATLIEKLTSQSEVMVDQLQRKDALVASFEKRLLDGEASFRELTHELSHCRHELCDIMASTEGPQLDKDRAGLCSRLLERLETFQLKAKKGLPAEEISKYERWEAAQSELAAAQARIKHLELKLELCELQTETKDQKKPKEETNEPSLMDFANMMFLCTGAPRTAATYSRKSVNTGQTGTPRSWSQA
ncbi:hypothetical protein CYMTET_18489 [Cymbomonas tetramitiformis]|uniref:Kinesin-like protein n=1 Tax=Cymbomonas tetramitiformis TaxID=36881 RepID=A0AAE0G8K5_9CHLO|nr:hypothetical protein CYMTET_18489 [Cymbomonas tetramitiformis]